MRAHATLYNEIPVSKAYRAAEISLPSDLFTPTQSCRPHRVCRWLCANHAAIHAAMVLKRAAAHSVVLVLPCGCHGRGFDWLRLLGSQQLHDQHGLLMDSGVRLYAGAEALQRVHVCVVVGRRDHEVSA